mmetsp:Transcript_52895/g.123810  ORF Transcript_52895/g.123810 Transcript_52895/m.123810 type:complete len:362 (-) Transcript_52895:124-1209(-)
MSYGPLTAGGGYALHHGVGPYSPASGSCSSETDLSRKIVDKLRRLAPGSIVAQASGSAPQAFPQSFAAPPGVPQAPSFPGLGQSLLEKSLQQTYGTMPLSADVLQQIQGLQGTAAAAAQLPLLTMVIPAGPGGGYLTLPAPADPRPMPPPQAAVPRRPEPEPEYPTEVMSAAELAAYQGPEGLEAARQSEEQEDFGDEDGEDAPHRLPPGFGAIPEDLILEKARAREEERIRAVKSRQPCRFGRACKKRDCPNQHPEGRSIDMNLNPCAFGRRCKRLNCFYDHPEGRLIDDDPNKGICRLGKRCKRPDCLYTHPEGRDAPAGEIKVCFFCHEIGHIATDCSRNPDSWAFRSTPALLALPNL